MDTPGFFPALRRDKAKPCFTPVLLSPFYLSPPPPRAQSTAATSVLLSPETPIVQPSRPETLIKLCENPIKMLYESVCHWQRFREEN